MIGLPLLGPNYSFAPKHESESKGLHDICTRCQIILQNIKDKCWSFRSMAQILIHFDSKKDHFVLMKENIHLKMRSTYHLNCLTLLAAIVCASVNILYFDPSKNLQPSVALHSETSKTRYVR